MVNWIKSKVIMTNKSNALGKITSRMKVTQIWTGS